MPEARYLLLFGVAICRTPWVCWHISSKVENCF